MNDILTIWLQVYSHVILDILGYLLKLIGIPEAKSWGIVGRWTYYMIKMKAF